MVEEKDIKKISQEKPEEIKKESEQKLTIEALEETKKRFQEEIDKINKEIEKRNKPVEGEATPQEEKKLEIIIQEGKERGEEAKEKIDETVKEAKISGAKDFKDLIENILPSIGDIESPTTGYISKKEDIIKEIKEWEKDVVPLIVEGKIHPDSPGATDLLSHFTRTYGLREKIYNLLKEQLPPERREAEVVIPIGEKPEGREETIEKVVSAKETESEREGKLEKLSYDIFEKRMKGEGEYSHEKIDVLLRSRGINPWTPEAQKFMEKWDGLEAERVLKERKEEEKKPEEKKKEEEKKVEPEKKAEKEAEVSEKMFVFRSKIENSNLPREEKDKLLKEVACVDSEKLGKQEVPRQLADELLNLLTKETPKEKEKIKEAVEESKKLTEKISPETGLSPEEVNKIINDQKARLETMAKAQFGEKVSKWKMIGKIGLYAGIGATAFIPVIGPFGAMALGAVAKGLDSYFGISKEKQKTEKTLKGAREFLATDSAESLQLKDELTKGIFAQIAAKKQNQINRLVEGKPSDLDKKIDELEKKREKTPEEKGELEKFYQEKKISQEAETRNYLKEQGLSPEEIEERAKKITSLVELDAQDRKRELAFIEKRGTWWNKTLDGINKVLNLPEGKSIEAKYALGTFFTVAGLVGRSYPGVRRLMAGFGVMKLAQILARKRIEKGEKILAEVSSKELGQYKKIGEKDPKEAERILYLAKLQIADLKFQQKNPIEYAFLKEQVYKIERERVKESLEYVKKSEEALEKMSEEKLSAEKRAKFGMIIASAAGFAAGFLGSMLIEDFLKARAAEAKEAVAKAAVKPEKAIDYTEKIGKRGIWSAAEKQLEECKSFDHLKSQLASRTITQDQFEAQKTYLIDALKDKIVADPSKYIKEGVIDMTSFFKGEDVATVTNALKGAGGLLQHPEAVVNIIQNNRLAEQVIAHVDKASDENLRKVFEMYGGEGQAGPLLNNELHDRIIRVTATIKETFQDLIKQGKIVEGTKALLDKTQGGFGGFLRKFFKPSSIENVKNNLAHAKEIYNQIKGNAVGSTLVERLQDLTGKSPAETLSEIQKAMPEISKEMIVI